MRLLGWVCPLFGTTYNCKVIQLTHERSFCDKGGFGVCDGTNPVDGNQIPAGQKGAGYPAMGQPGRGTDADGDGVFEPSPCYAWNNTFNGAELNMALRRWGPKETELQAGHVKEGRDFFNEAPPAGYYKPYIYLPVGLDAVDGHRFGLGTVDPHLESPFGRHVAIAAPPRFDGQIHLAGRRLAPQGGGRHGSLQVFQRIAVIFIQRVVAGAFGINLHPGTILSRLRRERVDRKGRQPMLAFVVAAGHFGEGGAEVSLG